jgi:hypothetical protein
MIGVLSGTGALQGAFAEGRAEDAVRGVALSVAVDLVQRLVADGYLVLPNPDTWVVRVPVPRDYRSEAA